MACIAYMSKHVYNIPKVKKEAENLCLHSLKASDYTAWTPTL
jgi:hypothetical protein